jgi:threonine dehydrogenase-like Zn-dependent dehydrogenase
MTTLAANVATFPERIGTKLAQWERALAGWRAAGKRVVIWGSGSKGVSFLTAVKGAAEAVAYAVDINPYRRGYFMPGTGQEIVGPEQLPSLQPDVVIVMNSVYVPEIKATLAQFGLSPELHAL